MYSYLALIIFLFLGDNNKQMAKTNNLTMRVELIFINCLVR